MIRTAEVKDVPRIVAMARRFYDAVPQPWPWSEDDMTETVRGLVEHEFAIVSDCGFILGLKVENPISRGWIIAKEFLWWSEDNSGMALLSAFRDWARKVGADEIQLSCPPGAVRVNRVYRRYAQASEIVYSEVI